MPDTIVAVATAYAKASISIIRLSGSKALEFGLKLSNKKELKPRYAYFSSFKNQNKELLDEGLIIYFKAPHSFTGEDVVEFQIHGGVVPSELIIDELLKLGAKPAKAGEFSLRACLNNKMDIIKAIKIQELINTKSKGAARLINQNLGSKLYKLLKNIRKDIVKNLAFVEASIDYAEEIPENTLKKIVKNCEDNTKKLEKLLRLSEGKKGLIKGFTLLIIGKPNVGKSSLLNALLSRQRALVSSQAGTTRDFIEEELIIGKHLVRIIDTAGIRKTKDEIEAKGVDQALKMLKEADIILALFDASKPLDSEDEAILKRLKKSKKKIFFIVNKSDLEQKIIFEKAHIKLDIKKDLNLLLASLNKYLDSLLCEDLILTNSKLIFSLEEALVALQKAVLLEDELELFAFWLNLALEKLAPFSKDLEHSELLDSIFSNFCLGK